jgi:hypothetical protein
MLVQSGLFNENNFVVFSKPGEKMLGPLIYKIPAQMGKNNNCRHWGSLSVGWDERSSTDEKSK